MMSAGKVLTDAFSGKIRPNCENRMDKKEAAMRPRIDYEADSV